MQMMTLKWNGMDVCEGVDISHSKQSQRKI